MPQTAIDILYCHSIPIHRPWTLTSESTFWNVAGVTCTGIAHCVCRLGPADNINILAPSPQCVSASLVPLAVDRFPGGAFFLAHVCREIKLNRKKAKGGFVYSYILIFSTMHSFAWHSRCYPLCHDRTLHFISDAVGSDVVVNIW